MQGMQFGEAFSDLGVTLGTYAAESVTDYVEAAFVNATVPSNLNMSLKCCINRSLGLKHHRSTGSVTTGPAYSN